MDKTVAIKLLHTVDNIVMSAIGATVFIFGFIHATPLTTIAAEYVGIYGTYFGVHVFSSNSVSAKGIAASANTPAAGTTAGTKQ
jgi:hypothetical protein